jgi:transcriptional regulator with XRE-family HTH domain
MMNISSITVTVNTASSEDAHFFMNFFSRGGLKHAMPVRGWRERLKDAIAISGRSARAISIEAGMSPGYLHGILNEGKDPTLINLLAVCEVLGVSLAYIVHGYMMNHGTEQLLKSWAHLSPEAQKAVLANLDAVAGQKPEKSPKPGSEPTKKPGPLLTKLRRSRET